MSEIKRGDLVMVVRGHQCDLGMTFRVARVGKTSDLEPTLARGWHCRKCWQSDVTDSVVAESEDDTRVIAPLWWLIRIDPPAHSTDSETDREVDRHVSV